MNCFKKLLIGSLFLGFSFVDGYAQQTDTLIVLSEVNVTEHRLTNFNAGSTVYQPNQHLISQKATLRLDDVLLFLSPMNVDAYGTGSSGINARGAGSNRTPILWNGFNLQSIMNGGTDISTLPLLFIDNLKVEMGGNSALFGSGAVGGVIYMDNKANFAETKRSQLSLSRGNFQYINGTAGIQFGNKNYSGVVRTFFQQSDNDFPFEGEYINKGETIPVKTDLPNANSHQYGVMSNNYFRLNNGHSINVHLWHQNISRQIAPTIKDIAKEKISDALQEDASTRGSAEWDMPLAKGMISVRSGLFATETYYQKPSTNSTTTSKGLTSINEAELDLQFTDWLKWNLGVNYTYEQVKSTSYENTNSRNRYAAFTSIAFNNKTTGTHVSLNGRGEKAGESDFTSTGSLGLTQSIIKNLLVKGKIGTSYRIPTFNDLYWYSATSVGNANLQAETGLNYEGGLQYSIAVKKVQFLIEGTYFKNVLENWISWGQREDGIWTVFNQDEAEIKGFELHANLMIEMNKSLVGFNANYTQQDATDPNTGNLLPYVPKSKTSAAVFGEYEGFRLSYAHSFIHERYTSSSNSTLMPKYNIGNLSFEKSFIGKVETVVSFKIKNIWNENYQTRQYYPMPGRNFLLGIQFSLN